MKLISTVSHFRVVVRMTVPQFKRILRNDAEHLGVTSLLTLLEQLDEVDRVEYDGHFGPHVFVDIAVDNLTRTELLATIDAATARIERVIETYIKE